MGSRVAVGEDSICLIRCWIGPRNLGDSAQTMNPNILGVRPSIMRASLLLATLLAGAQDVVFQSQTREVLLEVVVRDAHGKLVTKLDLSQVSVYEDGVRQDIKSFRLVSGQEVRAEMQRQTELAAIKPGDAVPRHSLESFADGQRRLPHPERPDPGHPSLRVRRGEEVRQQGTAPRYVHRRLQPGFQRPEARLSLLQQPRALC